MTYPLSKQQHAVVSQVVSPRVSPLPSTSAKLASCSVAEQLVTFATLRLSALADTSRSLPQTSSSTSATTSANPLPRQYPSSLSKTLGIIYREEGVRVLFSGVVPRVIWISLGGAVFLGVYEAAKKTLEGDRVARIERGE